MCAEKTEESDGTPGALLCVQWLCQFSLNMRKDAREPIQDKTVNYLQNRILLCRRLEW